jgi:Protein of unknown function (DUF2865)
MIQALRKIQSGSFPNALIGLFMASAAALFGLQPAFAQSPVCLQLMNELRAIDSGGGFMSSSPQTAEYERAIRDQRAQILKTEGAAQRSGCTGFNIFKRNSPICSRITSSLKQMQANLRDLERNLARLSPSAGASQERRQAVLRDIEIYNCGIMAETPQAVVLQQQRQPRERSLLEQIFGVRTYREDGFRSGTEFDPDLGLGARYGTYRTLCVRTCDGYYFPISFSTVSQRFLEDEQTCQAMCPGMQVELYYHQMPMQDSEDMVSASTNIPYTELPTAFAYREHFDPDCTCKSAGTLYDGDTDQIASAIADAVYPPPEPAIPTPTFSPDRSLDPEAVANLGGLLTRSSLEQLKPRTQLLTSGGEEPSGRQVRIVGPAFFPVQ